MDYFPPAFGPLATITRPVAVLRHGPKQLQGVRFRAAYDDLDELEWAEVVGTLGRRYALVRHRHAPEPGTEIVVSSESREPWNDVLDVLSVLQLSKRDLKWSHPEIAAKLDEVGRRLPRLKARRAVGKTAATRWRAPKAQKAAASASRHTTSARTARSARSLSRAARKK